MTAPRVLITGACGYIGSLLVQALAKGRTPVSAIVATDLRDPPQAKRIAGVEYVAVDIRSPELAATVERYRPDVVVHLAAIVTPGRDSDRELEYSVDVVGTKNLLDACVAAGVRRVVVSSSGAAYGYHADNPAWLTEEHPLRGNESYPYSHHKRLVEEMLARLRTEHPQLEQVIFRIGSILGETVTGPITEMFERPKLIAIRGSDSPFVFIWDHDVVGAIVHAIAGGPAGIYNLAGDGALTIHQVAKRLGKPCLVVPHGLLYTALWVLKRLRLSRYGPERLLFLRYRPVLDNARLKRVFGYRPQKTSKEVFDFYCRTHGFGPPGSA